MFIRFMKTKRAINLDNFDEITILLDREWGKINSYMVVAKRYADKVTSVSGTLNVGGTYSDGECFVVIEKYSPATDKDAEKKANEFYDRLQYAWINRLDIFEVDN